MNEICGICLQCRATITLPMPDAWERPDGEIEPADHLDEDVEALRAF
jgi:hypothetical protein